ncbi:MAG: DUF4418 family protein [Butyrivibrio sp.]|nr:DUF4418 family protein [Butyrivibrio sp.]
MKNKVTVSIIFVVLGVLILLAPTVIFPVCPADMKMHCQYTKQAEIGIGILIAVLGILTVFFSEKIRAGISIAIAGISALEIAVPTTLIGVCGNNMMTCNSATRPLLVVLGVLAIIVSVVNSFYLLKVKKA